MVKFSVTFTPIPTFGRGRARHLNVIVRSEVKEPVSFRGDGHDTHTGQESEALMVAYMRKKGIPHKYFSICST